MTPFPPSHIRLVPSVVVILRSVHEEQDEECDEEEDAIHYAKREARLLHCAVLCDAG